MISKNREQDIQKEIASRFPYYDEKLYNLKYSANKPWASAREAIEFLASQDRQFYGERELRGTISNKGIGSGSGQAGSKEIIAKLRELGVIYDFGSGRIDTDKTLDTEILLKLSGESTSECSLDNLETVSDAHDDVADVIDTTEIIDTEKIEEDIKQLLLHHHLRSEIRDSEMGSDIIGNLSADQLDDVQLDSDDIETKWSELFTFFDAGEDDAGDETRYLDFSSAPLKEYFDKPVCDVSLPDTLDIFTLTNTEITPMVINHADGYTGREWVNLPMRTEFPSDGAVFIHQLMNVSLIKKIARKQDKDNVLDTLPSLDDMLRWLNPGHDADSGLAEMIDNWLDYDLQFSDEADLFVGSVLTKFDVELRLKYAEDDSGILEPNEGIRRASRVSDIISVSNFTENRYYGVNDEVIQWVSGQIGSGRLPISPVSQKARYGIAHTKIAESSDIGGFETKIYQEIAPDINSPFAVLIGQFGPRDYNEINDKSVHIGTENFTKADDDNPTYDWFEELVAEDGTDGPNLHSSKSDAERKLEYLVYIELRLSEFETENEEDLHKVISIHDTLSGLIDNHMKITIPGFPKVNTRSIRDYLSRWDYWSDSRVLTHSNEVSAYPAHPEDDTRPHSGPFAAPVNDETVIQFGRVLHRPRGGS